MICSPLQRAVHGSPDAANFWWRSPYALPTTMLSTNAWRTQAPEGSFGSAIYVPTPDGFSNEPGCVESYAATARFRLYTKGDKVEGDGLTRPLVLREEVEIKV